MIFDWLNDSRTLDEFWEGYREQWVEQTVTS